MDIAEGTQVHVRMYTGTCIYVNSHIVEDTVLVTHMSIYMYITYSGYISSGQSCCFCSVTSRNENWTHVFLDKTGVVYQYTGKTELKPTKSNL